MSTTDAVAGGGFRLIPGYELDTLVMPSGLTRNYVDGRPIAALVRTIRDLESRVRPDGDGVADKLAAENAQLRDQLAEATRRAEDAEAALAVAGRQSGDPAVWRAAAKAAIEILAACRVNVETLDYHGRPLGDRWKLYQYNMRIAHGLPVDSKG